MACTYYPRSHYHLLCKLAPLTSKIFLPSALSWIGPKCKVPVTTVRYKCTKTVCLSDCTAARSPTFNDSYTVIWIRAIVKHLSKEKDNNKMSWYKWGPNLYLSALVYMANSRYIVSIVRIFLLLGHGKCDNPFVDLTLPIVSFFTTLWFMIGGAGVHAAEHMHSSFIILFLKLLGQTQWQNTQRDNNSDSECLSKLRTRSYLHLLCGLQHYADMFIFTLRVTGN